MLIAAALASEPAAQRQFQPTRGISFPAIPGYALDSGDVDSDGDIDLVVANDHSPNRLFLNDGRGLFVDATAGRLTTPTNNATYRANLIDIDGDRDLDLLVCNDHYLPNRVHVNNGAGVFTDVSATALPANNYFSTDQVIGDFDGDGDVDWLVVDLYSSSHLYLNNGAGVFSDVTSTHLPTFTAQYQQGHAAADLDGDGDLDIVLSVFVSSTLTILINQGGARFQLAAANYFPRSVQGDIWIADVNGDNRPDVFLGRGSVLLMNQGGGTFVDVSATALPRQSPYYGVLLDADGDGDLDIVAGNALALNDGLGQFSAANARAPASLIGDVRTVAADVDGDGDLDLIDMNAGILCNFHRQVSAATAPVINAGYTVDFLVRPGYGQGPYLVAPALAPSEAVLPLPGLGTLRLAPARLLFLGISVVPPQTGRVSISYSLPNDPALRGGEVHHQALVIESPVQMFLTGALRDVIQ
jgi:hypothetical protein